MDVGTNNILNNAKHGDIHCVKSVQIRSFFWSVFSCIRTEYGKIRTRKNSVFGHFLRSDKPISLMKSRNFETGLSDCHEHVCSILRASFKKPPIKIVKYKDHKHFDQKNFLHDLDSKLLQGYLYRNCDEPYEKLSEFLTDISNHHAPLKEKQIRGSHAPSIIKELRKAIMEESKTRNEYLRWPSREKYVYYKKSKNKCN